MPVSDLFLLFAEVSIPAVGGSAQSQGRPSLLGWTSLETPSQTTSLGPWVFFSLIKFIVEVNYPKSIPCQLDTQTYHFKPQQLVRYRPFDQDPENS